MLDILASGRVIKLTPATSANNKPYIRLTVLVGNGDDATLVNAMAFDEGIREALGKVTKGDVLSVSGTGKLSAYTKEGEARASLTVFISRILTHKVGKQKARNNDYGGGGGGGGGYGDSYAGHNGRYEQPWGLD